MTQSPPWNGVSSPKKVPEADPWVVTERLSFPIESPVSLVDIYIQDHTKGYSILP